MGEDGKPEGRVRRIVGSQKFGTDGSEELLAALRGCASVHDVYTE